MAADVVGYSRLIGADEGRTLAAMRSLLKDVVEPALKRHRGRVVKLMGDGLLAEFASVVDAVAAAVEIQEAVPNQSADLPEDRRIALRIGVNIGDVAVEDADLFGDGVNIASRLQEIAEPNGVAVSNDAHRQLSGRLDLPFSDIGEKALKNIAEPVRIWMWSPAISSAGARAKNASPAVPDKPSVAVLPFDNMSGDPEQDYFADGITEDIITALSYIRQLFVMARNTSFTFKGQSINVQTVARELGVRYILEGSVRKAGNRVRITAQLIDGVTGDHLWAERYDRDLEDIFAVQDEITQVVAGAIEPEISKAEFERVRRTSPGNLDAWSMYQHGMHHFNQYSDEDDEEARRFFRAAIALDPSFSMPHTSLARSYSRGAMRVQSGELEEYFRIAVESARMAVSLDREDAYAHAGLGFALHRNDVDTAIRSFEQALSLNPNLAVAYYGIGMALIIAGQPERAKTHLETAIRLSPRDPISFLHYGILGTAYFAMGDYEKAIELSSKGRVDYRYAGRVGAMRIAAFALLGREDEMIKERDALLTLLPHLTVPHVLSTTPGLGDRFAEGLRMAKIPE